MVDASLVVNALSPHDGFAPYAGHELLAPPLLWSETASAIHEAASRREISRELARQAFDRLALAPIRRRAPARLHHEAWDVAERLGWARTYDAEYVALARIERCPLLTADRRLRRGAVRLVDTLGPTEL